MSEPTPKLSRQQRAEFNILYERLVEDDDALQTFIQQAIVRNDTLAAKRTALLALAERIRREGMQGVANSIEEIIKNEKT